MGLIMLILVGTVPTAYALNHAIGPKDIQSFAAVSTVVAGSLNSYKSPTASIQDPEADLQNFVAYKKFTPSVINSLQAEIIDIRNETLQYGDLKNVPAGMQANVRNQMYLTSETLKLIAKSGPKMSAGEMAQIKNYKDKLDGATRFIPPWVKVAVALALGLGTMVGWKRIVVTVGEKIGKTHMTYAQGASAELVTMATILGADRIGVPVSTTHILNSGVAGTMAANRSGLQFSTIRDIAVAWVLTLPAAALLSGGLFWLFNQVVSHS
jgi:PiT family inorganic phosphate transporter